MSVCPSIQLFIHLSTYLFIHSSFLLSIYLFIYPSSCPSFRLSFHPPTHPCSSLVLGTCLSALDILPQICDLGIVIPDLKVRKWSAGESWQLSTELFALGFVHLSPSHQPVGKEGSVDVQGPLGSQVYAGQSTRVLQQGLLMESSMSLSSTVQTIGGGSISSVLL